MTPIASLAKKYRSALRNNKGARFTAEELRQLAEAGMLDLVQAAEAEELKAQWRERSDAAAALEKPILDRGAIEQLTSGTPVRAYAATYHTTSERAQEHLERAMRRKAPRPGSRKPKKA